NQPEKRFKQQCRSYCNPQSGITECDNKSSWKNVPANLTNTFGLTLFMHVDVIIVGQGISGTMLSWFLQKENKSFIVFDEVREHSASRVAAGIINPVTGRRYAYTWMIDEV